MKQKKLKQMNSMVIAIALVVATWVPLGAGATGVDKTLGSFNDVPANFWAASDIYTARALGIVGGVGGNNFKPNDKLTIAQGYALIEKTFGQEFITSAKENVTAASDNYNGQYFPDLPKSHWFHNMVPNIYDFIWVHVDENENEYLYPDSNMSRAEFFATIGEVVSTDSDILLNEAITIDEDDVMQFISQHPELKGYNLEYAACIERVVRFGLVKGDTNGNLKLEDSITRAEATTLLLDTLNFMVNNSLNLADEIPNWYLAGRTDPTEKVREIDYLEVVFQTLIATDDTRDGAIFMEISVNGLENSARNISLLEYGTYCNGRIATTGYDTNGNFVTVLIKLNFNSDLNDATFSWVTLKKGNKLCYWNFMEEVSTRGEY